MVPVSGKLWTISENWISEKCISEKECPHISEMVYPKKYEIISENKWWPLGNEISMDTSTVFVSVLITPVVRVQVQYKPCGRNHPVPRLATRRRPWPVRSIYIDAAPLTYCTTEIHVSYEYEYGSRRLVVHPTLLVRVTWLYTVLVRFWWCMQ